MKKFILLLLILISYVSFSANHKKPDSLVMKQLEKYYVDAYDLIYQNLPGVDKYADSIQELSQKHNYEKGLSYAYEIRANYYKNQNNLPLALDYFNKAQELDIKYKDTLNIANIHSYFGVIYNEMYLYDKSIFHYLEAIKLFESINELEHVGRSYYNLSNIYLKLNNYEKMKEILNIAIDYLKRANSEFGIALTKVSLAMVLIDEKKYDLAWRYLNEAEEPIKKANYPAATLGLMFERGRIYQFRNKFDYAEKFYLESYDLAVKLKVQGNTLNSAWHYAKLLLDQDKVGEAHNFLTNLDSTLFKTRYFEEIQKAYETYSLLYQGLNKIDSALYYSKLSSSFKDSIYNLDLMNRIHKMDVIFSIYEKDKYIKSLEQEKKINELELYRKESSFRILLIVTISLILLLTLLFVFLFYRSKKRKEKISLREQIVTTESRLQLILEGTDQGIYGIDINGNCTFINNAGAKLLGYLPEECIGKNMHDLIHHSHEDGSHYERHDCPFSNVSLKVERKEGEYLFRKDGLSFVSEISSFPIYENEKLTGAVITFFDISDRIKTREELKEALKKYRLLAEFSGDVIWTMDLTGRFTYVSPSVYYLRGYTPEEVMLQTPDQVVCPGSMENLMKGFEIAQEEIRTGIKRKSVYFEIEQPCKDGTTVWTEAIGRVMYDEDNVAFGIVGITRNIEERKKAQEEKNTLLEELRASNELLEVSIYQKNSLIEELSQTKIDLEVLNSEKDKFFSILAHDLKSPFSGFLGLTEILANDVSDFSLDELQEIGKNLKDSANNLYKLLDNLLQWSKMQRGKIEYNPENFLIDALITQNVNIQSEVARQKEISINNTVSNSTYVYADIPMINTVLRNLLSNALKFTPRGGKIYIGLAKDAPEGFIKLFIQDSGIGMPNKIKENLFKIDQKVSRPGTDNEPSTGLGLLLCKEFIEKNKGRIIVESEVGFGSIFYVELPTIS